MSKTPEQMAEEYAVQCPPHFNSHYKAFLAGYQAAKDEILSKGMQGYITEIRNDAWCTAMQLGQQSQWISVKERLPEIFERVLILIRGGKVFISSIEEEYGDEYPRGVITYWDGDWDWPEVTHWMPLPSAEGLKHED